MKSENPIKVLSLLGVIKVITLDYTPLTLITFGLSKKSQKSIVPVKGFF